MSYHKIDDILNTFTSPLKSWNKNDLKFCKLIDKNLSGTLFFPSYLLVVKYPNTFPYLRKIFLECTDVSVA